VSKCKTAVTILLVCALTLFSSLLYTSTVLWESSAQKAIAQPFHVATPAASSSVAGYTPTQIRTAYNLPSSGGEGTTIAIINAYDTPTILEDLTVFCNQFGLPLPTSSNFEIHKMTTNLGTDKGWGQETALDVEWAHAIAPQAKILLVEAASQYDTDLLKAVNYARSRSDVVAISMSWGVSESSWQLSRDSYFTSNYGAVFFAASGDDGAGVMWPSSSPNVVGVGGTTLTLTSSGSVISETAWSKSGGGISAYEAKPTYQSSFVSGTKRCVPDVSYNADPNTGVPIYYNGNWYKMGGTSAGAPQWAAIHALSMSVSNTALYQQATTAYAKYFRDITSGSNGGYTASTGYDCVTGLGSPLTYNFASSTANSLTLVPAGQSTPLNSTNRFSVTYLLNGVTQTTYAANGTLTLTTDPGASLTVAGTSTGSSTSEKWVLNLNGNSVTGTNMTLYYYDLLWQSTSFAVNGDAALNPTVTYSTAPSTAPTEPSPQTATLALSTNQQTFWSLKGSEVTVTNPFSFGGGERWATQTSNWTITAANQVPQKLTYYHQYSATVNYQVADSSSPTPPTLTATMWGVNASMPLSVGSNEFWLDAGTQYALTNPLVGLGANERWITYAANGAANAPVNLAATYYHQFNVSVAFSAADYEGSVVPVFYYTTSGNTVGLALESFPQSVWADANTAYSVQPQLEASSAERWFNNDTGTIQAAAFLNFTYVHQFLLTVTGAQTSQQWYNSGDSPQISVPAVSDRASGTGQRVNTYTIDGGNAVEATPTTGTVTITVTMDTAHQIQIGSVRQFQVTLDAEAQNMLASITAPTVSGDGGWYDEGTPVRVTLNGVADRADGAGTRLVSYAVNEATNVASAGVVEALNVAALASPQTVTAQTITQYQFTTASGALNGVTEPQIVGDAGWYDSGTQVTATYNNVWNTQNQARLNAVSYTVDQTTQQLPRSATGTFTVQVSMTKPQTVAVASVKQYAVSVAGGLNTQVSAASPTGDGYFDEGTQIQVSSNQMLTDASGQARQVLVSYTLDGTTTNLTQTEDTFTTPTIIANMGHQLVFNTITQYKVAFGFTDHNGTHPITPASVQIQTAAGLVDVPQLSLWLDSGTQFTLANVTWQGADVKPTEQTSFAVNSPLNETVHCRVFDGKIVVLDSAGKAAVGAQVLVTLANQTTVQLVTDSEGAADLLLIPQGTFNATVSFKGLSTVILGDAATQSTTTARLPSQLIFIVVELGIAVAVAAVVVVAVAVYVLRKRTQHSKLQVPSA
jgi:hypothetical protein